MTGDLWPSAFAAALFAIHPLHVESVAWVAERKDVLSGLFFMLTLAAYTGYVRRPFSLSRYLLVTVLFALGLMAKPMLVTLPFVLLLLDYWPLGRGQGAGSEGGPEQAGYLGTRAGRIREQGPTGRATTAAVVADRGKAALADAGGRLLRGNVLGPGDRGCRFAMLAALDPDRQRLGFLRRLPGPVLLSRGAGPILSPSARLPPDLEGRRFRVLLAGISLVVLACRRKCPYLPVGWLWYLGMLLPVIGLVQVGLQAKADRYTYLTQIGLYMAIAWGSAHVASSGAFTVGPWRPSRCW